MWMLSSWFKHIRLKTQSEPVISHQYDDDLLFRFRECEDIRENFVSKIDEERGKIKRKKTRSRTVPRNNVRIYVDNSNIAYGAGNWSETLNVEGLHNLVTRGRPVMAAYVVGSFPDDARYWKRWDNLGYITRPGPIGKEYGVDESLHAVIFKDAAFFATDNYTAIILTGDGNMNGGWSSFPDCIRFLLKLGLRVELWCWSDRTSNIYRGEEFSEMTIVNLDEYRDKVTE